MVSLLLCYNYTKMQLENGKTFDHDKASASDKIRLIAELEHIRAHALRAAASTWEEEDDSESVKYLIIAKRAQRLRRDYMRNHFPDIKDQDWCLCKSAACLRQVLYEVNDGWPEELKEIDDFVDEVWGHALDMDLSDCVACKDDREA